MITMCLKIKYTPEAMKTIFTTGDNRKSAISTLAEQAGGKLISLFFSKLNDQLPVVKILI